MLERELKLYVPPSGRPDLEAELRQAGAQTITLRARYYDTQDEQLARAGIALRLRLEGDQWVQTIKAPGPDELTRLELNHPCRTPELNLSVYEGTAVAERVAGLNQPLLMQYETDIERLVWQDKHPEGVIEFAYDQGVIRSGQHELKVCELELEQVSGSLERLFALGQNYQERYGLILDFRSKSERGNLLSHLAWSATPATQASTTQTTLSFAPRPAQNVTLTPDMSLQQAYARHASECLNQIVRNAMPLATADTAQTQARVQAEYTRHMRTGIQNMLTAWKLYSSHVQVDPASAYSNLEQYVAPDIQNADHARALAASTAFQACLLAILKHLLEPV